MIDFVVIYHRDAMLQETERLLKEIRQYERTTDWEVYPWDNREENLGFAKAANKAAAAGSSHVIGFLNPDLRVGGPFIRTVCGTLQRYGAWPLVTGSSFGKSRVIIENWGLKDWVCGANFFVVRDWFEKLGGFDEGFVWGLEETDFCLRTQTICGEIPAHIMKHPILSNDELPLLHVAIDDRPEDRAYKQAHYQAGRFYFRKKWGILP